MILLQISLTEWFFIIFFMLIVCVMIIWHIVKYILLKFFKYDIGEDGKFLDSEHYHRHLDNQRRKENERNLE